MLYPNAEVKQLRKSNAALPYFRLRHDGHLLFQENCHGQIKYLRHRSCEDFLRVVKPSSVPCLQ
ncbi:uncharacterized protein BCR38DRAFT_146052 [Pseudomassariella vexata]|uniref:Uncharacterized protein n=1 Tax=Pseudomassariella vexata TaxID=1141098 RepID=A0A1Y2D6A7_9PEZI|nr:uncharacterized protein BCR38DRAFT_146052 [Pseudomassariella vexata]ORY54828.1 hypothetical protein BCR38DRAFT_146052 [Pseudomassariella vexata]